MKYDLTGQEYQDPEGNTVELAIFGYAGHYQKLLEVRLANSKEKYVFFESDFSKLPHLFTSEKPIGYLEWDIEASFLAIKEAKKLNSIKLIKIEQDCHIQQNKYDNKNWVQTFKVTTSLGILYIGYGYQCGMHALVNASWAWPNALVYGDWKVLHNSNIISHFPQGLLFSYIGRDILENQSAPDINFPNPLLNEYNHSKLC